ARFGWNESGEPRCEVGPGARETHELMLDMHRILDHRPGTRQRFEEDPAIEHLRAACPIWQGPKGWTVARGGDQQAEALRIVAEEACVRADLALPEQRDHIERRSRCSARSACV